MDVSNDTQHVNTVWDFEVGVTKRGKPSVIHGDFENWRHRQKSVGQVSHLEMLPVSSSEVSCSWQSHDFINRATHTWRQCCAIMRQQKITGCSYATCSTSNSAMKGRWLYRTRMLLHVAFSVIAEHATRLHQLSFQCCKLESTSMFLAGKEKWWYVMWMLTATATFWYLVNKITDQSTNMVIKGIEGIAGRWDIQKMFRKIFVINRPVMNRPVMKRPATPSLPSWILLDVNFDVSGSRGSPISISVSNFENIY